MADLEQENESLKAEIGKLKKELNQKDGLIAALESQINILQIYRKESIGSESKQGSLSTTQSANRKKSSRWRAVQEPEPATGSLSPKRSLQPPTRSYEQNRQEVPQLLHSDDILDSGVKTRLDSKISEGNEDDFDEAPTLFRSSKGAIKALPRELSIYNGDGDDVTKYSSSTANLWLEKSEMRDAYNARGVYTGEVSRKEQMPHGKGRMDYHLQGRFYEGEWNKGHWHGFGTIRNARGDYYRGQVVNDLREGKGALTYADGRTFEGTFSKDDAVKGNLTFTDGAKYVGELHNGTRHGYGVYYFAGKYSFGFRRKQPNSMS
jgi:hypothetical protein